MVSKVLVLSVIVAIVIISVVVVLFSGPQLTKYTDSTNTFSISYHKGWEKTNFTPLSGLEAQQKNLEGPSVTLSKGNNTGVFVVVLKLPINESIPQASVPAVLDQYVSSIETGLKAVVPEYKKISLANFTLSSHPAKELIYEGKKNGKQFKMKSVMSIKDRFSISVLFASENYDANIKEADSIIFSFTLLK